MRSVFNKAALYIYFGVFFSLVGAGLGLPIPEEVPILTAGVMAGHTSEDPVLRQDVGMAVSELSATPDAVSPSILRWHAQVLALNPGDWKDPGPPLRLHVWILLPLCILGVVISDGLLYGMGRFWGPRLLELRWMKRLLPGDKRRRIEDNFHKYGVMVLLFARFLPTIRSPIFIMAGIMRVSFVRFVIADGLYALPGVSLLFFLAFWFGDQFRDLILAAETSVAKVGHVLILLLIVGVAIYLVHHFLRHPVATGDPREELPVIGGLAAKAKHAHQPPSTPEDGKWARSLPLPIPTASRPGAENGEREEQSRQKT
jgi:membrane protein DedA with SNARE-associated domain